MRTLAGKKCLVTGAASGIGRAIALRLADNGAHVYCLDIDAANLSRTIQDVRARGVQAIGCICDVSDATANDHAIDQLLDRWPAVDVLVNNAGVCYYGPTESMTQQQFSRLLAINLHAPIQFTLRLLPLLLNRPEAHILNVASILGLVVTNRCVAYHTSKFGLVAFSETLRLEYGRWGLGITALCPGFVKTELYSSMMNPRSADLRKKIPSWAWTTPERVARKAIQGIHRDKRLVLVTPLAHAAYHGRRLVPGLMDRLHRIGRSRKMRKRQLDLQQHEVWDRRAKMKAA